MDKNKRKSTKLTSKSADKKPKPKPKTEVKVNQQEKDFQRLEEYLTESGLSLAFNIIFAELISKQILRENYFTYTAMRLTQIGKEIEGLKTKEIIYVEDKEEEKKNEENLVEKAEQTDLLSQRQNEKNEDDIFMTQQKPKEKPKEKGKEKPKENPKEKSKEKPKENPKEKPKENPKQKSKEKPKENAKEKEKKSEVKSQNKKKK
jgi:hypothetical protein